MDKESMDRIAKEIMSFYGNVKPWNDARLLALQAKHFAGYLPDKVISAVESYAAEHPDRAPTPAQLLDWMRKDNPPPVGLTDPERCSHPQPWALVDERSEHDSEDRPPMSPLTLNHPVGTRVAMCIRCHTEIIRKPGTFLTETEIEDHQRQRQEARHG